MIHITEKAKCSGCYACAEKCPKKCITMVSDEEGFWYPQVDASACIECGLCEKICPILSHVTPFEGERPIAYAARNKNESVRLHSSSGGIFFALASDILAQGGAVFGAAFDADFNVVHKCIERIEDMPALQGSKYVQSRIGDAYKQAESLLVQGKKVLFSGTPCQIEGLVAYLGKPYENLITQDLICHGVPSPSVWQKYIAYRKSLADGASVESVAFRNKKDGWTKYSLQMDFENGAVYRATPDKDPMMQVFLKNLCLRPSCYDCSFKKLSRKSDITLADYWGIKSIHPDMDDDKGTSFVIIHSEKGRELFEKIRDKLDCVETDLNVGVHHNISMIRSAPLPKKRSAFLRDVKSENFSACQRKYCKKTFFAKCKSFAARVLRKARRLLKK